jgi:hypothetical protein
MFNSFLKNEETMQSYEELYENFLTGLSEAINRLSRKNIHEYNYLFKRDGLINVHNLLPDTLWSQLREETQAVVSKFGKKRDLRLGQTDNTRRALTTVGNDWCRKNGPCMSAIYDSSDFHGLLSEIAGERVSVFPDPVEQLAVSLMEEPGDTHGWHWDDCSFALIWMIECPPPSFGGFTQCVPNTGHEKGKTNIFEVLIKHQIVSYFFPEESFYFFRSGTTLHQVHPLVKPARRLIINMDFVSDQDLQRDLDTSTTQLFYSQ